MGGAAKKRICIIIKLKANSFLAETNTDREVFSKVNSSNWINKL